jgi:hypothetical protein
MGPHQRWEEDRLRITCSKMICMPHIYVIISGLDSCEDKFL